MADARLQVIIEAIDQTKAAMSSALGGLERYKSQLRTAGIALTAFGAAGTAAFGLAIKSAQEAQTSMRRLDQALQNTGRGYAALSGEIEAALGAMQRKTNFGDEAQRDALTTLISLTGDYQTSLAAMPALLDFATAKEMDLSSASFAIGKALTGNVETLRLYGIELEKGASATEVMAALTEKFGGQAEAAADPFVQLKNQVGEFAEKVGAVLLPIVTQVVGWLTKLMVALQGINPHLLQIGVLAGAAFVGFAALVGPLAIFASILPALVAGVPLLAAGMGTLATAAWSAAGAFVAMFPTILLVTAGMVFLTSIVDNLWRIIQGKPTLQIWEQFGLLMDTLKEKMKGFTTEVTTSLIPSLNQASAATEKLNDKIKLVGTGFSEESKAFGDLYNQMRLMGRETAPLLAMFDDLVKAGVDIDNAYQITTLVFKEGFNRELDELANKLKGGDVLLQAFRDSGLSLSKIMELLRDRIGDTTGQIKILTTTARDWLRVEREIADLEAKRGIRAPMAPPPWQVLPGPSELALRRAAEGAKTWEQMVEEATAPVTMQHGGIVMRPTVALLGERGPEAVIPLAALERLAERIAQAVARSGGGGQPVVLTLDGRVLATALGRLAEVQEQVRA